MSSTNVSGLIRCSRSSNCQTVHVRQLHVAQGDVETPFPRPVQRLLAGLRRRRRRSLPDRGTPPACRGSAARRPRRGSTLAGGGPVAVAGLLTLHAPPPRPQVPGSSGRSRRTAGASGRRTRKTAPPSAGGLEVDRAAVVGDQLAGHEQAQAGAVLLGGEIGLKQPGRVLRSDAAAVVAHRHLDAFGRRVTRQLDRGRRGRWRRWR